MIRINLLPPEERQPKLPLTRIFTVIAAVFTSSLLAIYSYGFFTILNLESNLQDIRIQYELLRPTQEKMQATNAMLQEINTKNAILVTLTQERKSWHSIMTHIGVLTTPNVWLTEVGLVEKNSLKIKGMAASYPDLAGFIKKLEQDELFVDTALLNAEKFNTNLTAGVASFELLVKVKGM